MRFLRWLRQRLQTRGQDREKASRWATDYYDGELRVVALKVGTLMMEQLGIDIGTVTPATRFVGDLQKRDLEPVELLLAVEEEFGIEISEEDAERASTIGGLIEYIYEQLPKRA